MDDERLPDPAIVGTEDEELTEAEVDAELVGAPTPTVSRDTPMLRITIDMMALDELDQLLSDLRQRRLLRVEAVRARSEARQHAQEEVELIKFDKLVQRVRKMLEKMQADEERVSTELNKLRIMATALGG